jgi:16S rRNA (cytosine1402-N4)-methyltransferase
MVEEVLAALRPVPSGVFIDCTYGRGGHARALLGALGPSARVIALDRDPAAIDAALQHAGEDPRLLTVRAPFSEVEAAADSHGVVGSVNGLLFDLGVSSPQLEDSERGFSFQQDGPLDMRMDPDNHLTAAAWLARADSKEIADVLWRFGEERYSRRIARAICEARREGSIDSTRRLVDIVEAAVPKARRPKDKRTRPRKHPATRTFQALRIFINRELEELQAALSQSVRILAPGGRLVTISFHSLEDRIAKRFMRAMARSEPRIESGIATVSPAFKVIGKPIRPGAAELEANPRARSAVMRVAERCA